MSRIYSFRKVDNAKAMLIFNPSLAEYIDLFVRKATHEIAARLRSEGHEVDEAALANETTFEIVLEARHFHQEEED